LLFWLSSSEQNPILFLNTGYIQKLKTAIKMNREEAIKKQAIKLHEEHKLGYIKISKILNVPKGTVARWIYCNNKFVKVKELPVEERLKLYHEAIKLRKEFGLSSWKIGAKLGVSPQTVDKWIYGKNKTCYRNVTKFKPNREFSYIVGAFLGDGKFIRSIRNREFGIELKVKDKDFAEEFARCCNIALDGIKRNYDVWLANDGRYKVRVRSKLLYQIFKKIRENFGEIKNLVLFPEDFLRGLADAEGSPLISVAYDSRNEKEYLKLRVRVVSNNNLGIINFCGTLLRSLNLKSTSKICVKKGSKTKLPDGREITSLHDTYEVIIQRFDDVKRFAKLVGFAIQRKQEKLEDAINTIEKYGTHGKAIQAWKELYEKINNRWVKRPTFQLC
jgi:intein-encoded DNA endonuclease-like protein